MTRFAFALASVLGLVATASFADATLTVQTRFESGRTLAINSVSTLRSCSVSVATPSDVRQWLLMAKDALLSDLQATPHELVQSAAATCASTTEGEASIVTLAVPVCVNEATTDRHAALTLLTMSAKHLGITSDRRALQIAQAVIDVRRSCDDAGMRIDSGTDHSCLVRQGRVSCWGSNADGQTTVPPLTNAKLIALGDGHTCALDSFGVKCWGRNDKGQTDVPGLFNVRALAAGVDNTCALHDNGVTCWGYNGGFRGPMPNLINPRELVVGGNLACALHDGATNDALCWGSSSRGPDAGAGRNLTDIRLHWKFACARMANGRLTCWGESSSGQIDVPADLGVPREFAVGLSHSCAVLENRVRCWGGTDSSRLNPAPLINPTHITVGDGFACAVDAVGVKCWGDNDVGQSTVPAELATF